LRLTFINAEVKGLADIVHAETAKNYAKFCSGPYHSITQHANVFDLQLDSYHSLGGSLPAAS